jgi:endonuclease YncB( thermonuclease family)
LAGAHLLPALRVGATTTGAAALKAQHTLVFAAISAAFIIASAQADTLTGTVIAVTDGDTVKVLTDEPHLYRVRLAGIDAPERKQPYGQAAKALLSDWVYQRRVVIETPGADRYGRLLGTIYQDGINVNAKLVEAGAAWVYRAYPHDPGFILLEAQAQAGQRGLWGLQADQQCPPWDWRRGRCPSQQQKTDKK